jgi:Protein of unknown function (DUF2585)
LTLDGAVPPLLVVAASALLVVLQRVALGSSRRATAGDFAIAAAIIVVGLLLERQMGRTPFYKNGPVRLWSGDITSDQNSQQIFDPYSFTHVIHGAAFYGLTRLVPATRALGPAVVAAVTLETAWEVYENTNQVINRYRAETVSLGYYGDSMLNSFFDVVACLIGLALAWRKRAWITLSWVIAVELILAVWIRDNLTLNILMLIHPIQSIKAWQMGA